MENEGFRLESPSKTVVILVETVIEKGRIHLMYQLFFCPKKSAYRCYMVWEVSEMEMEKINLSKTWELLFLSVT